MRVVERMERGKEEGRGIDDGNVDYCDDSCGVGEGKREKIAQREVVVIVKGHLVRAPSDGRKGKHGVPRETAGRRQQT